MNITIRTDNPRKIAKDCLDNHLYVKGWYLAKRLEAIYYFSDKDWKRLEVNKYDIVAAYVDGKPVGVMTLDDEYFNTFVKGDFRKKGIGTLLYKKMIQITKRDYEKIPMIKGSKGSLEFFDSLKHPTVNPGLEAMASMPKYAFW